MRSQQHPFCVAVVFSCCWWGFVSNSVCLAVFLCVSASRVLAWHVNSCCEYPIIKYIASIAFCNIHKIHTLWDCILIPRIFRPANPGPIIIISATTRSHAILKADIIQFIRHMGWRHIYQVRWRWRHYGRDCTHISPCDDDDAVLFRAWCMSVGASCDGFSWNSFLVFGNKRDVICPHV